MGGGHHLHPDRRGFVYLFAAIDWASRRVLSWRLSNTLTTDFCKEAVQEAINRYGKPEIFNTDQGCQFTSLDFTGLLRDNGIGISMDGKGCWRDARIWENLLEQLVADVDCEWLMIDAGHIKVHPHAAGAKGGSIPSRTWPWMRMVCRSGYLSRQVPRLIAHEPANLSRD